MDMCGGSEAALRVMCERMRFEQLIRLRRVFGEAADTLAARLDPSPMPSLAPEQAAPFVQTIARIFRQRFGTEIAAPEPVPQPVAARLAWEERVWAGFDPGRWASERASLE